MIHSTGADRRERQLSTADGDATAVTPPSDRFEEAGVVGSTPEPVAGEVTSHCPVCAFGSDDPDDVYVHLMTAHRKSTISAALLASE